MRGWSVVLEIAWGIISKERVFIGNSTLFLPLVGNLPKYYLELSLKTETESRFK